MRLWRRIAVQSVNGYVVCTITALVILLSGVWRRGPDVPLDERMIPVAVESGSGEWTLTTTDLDDLPGVWKAGQRLFAVVQSRTENGRGDDVRRLAGTVRSNDGGLEVEWETMASPVAPVLALPGLYREYKGATLTAKAFDSVVPGMGLWIVPAVAWLFAFSTIVSWSYYGEQGVVFLLGSRSAMPFRLVYCLLILVAASPLIRTEDELDAFSSLGTGLMLFANIPIMLLFGRQAMRAYHDYMRRLDRGEFTR